MNTTQTPEKIPAGADTSRPQNVDPGKKELNLATDAHVDLERAVLPTLVSSRIAWLMIVSFCAFLAVVPAVQIALEATGRHRAQLGDLFQRPPTRENLHQYEEDAARNS